MANFWIQEFYRLNDLCVFSKKSLWTGGSSMAENISFGLLLCIVGP